MQNQIIRDYNLQQVEKIFIIIGGQIDFLFDKCGQYLEMFENRNLKEMHNCIELRYAISEVARLMTELGYIVKHWKAGEQPVLSENGIRENIINEMHANLQVIYQFLIAQDFDLEPFSGASMDMCFKLMHRFNNIFAN